jgi:hypothetical protein
VALNKATSVNAIYRWNGDDVEKYSNSSYAVNGKNNQRTVIYSENSGSGHFPNVCTVTASDGTLGWWMVDLGETFNIVSVQVWGVPGIIKRSFLSKQNKILLAIVKTMLNNASVYCA